MDNPDFLQELERVESTVLSQPGMSAGPSRTRHGQRPTQQIEGVDMDKENQPGPKRKVRKIVPTKKSTASPNQTVINIEDSD